MIHVSVNNVIEETGNAVQAAAGTIRTPGIHTGSAPSGRNEQKDGGTRP